ncbi:MAG: hypothetical protein HKN28_05305 [Alphaproteobacteria bacterium]|nr:hypothetical protein [Alphaproteobacteria bacterium]
MVYFTETARQASAKIRQIFGDDPLLKSLGRASDSAIDSVLASRSTRRADLFTVGKTLAPHRRRLAKMLAAHHFSPRHIVANYWPELKHADHLCAHCANKKRCDGWLRDHDRSDAPRRFCPNVMTFERWRRDYMRSDADADGTKVEE